MTESGQEFLRELEIEVQEDLTLTESSLSDDISPVTEWLYDPTDVQREEAGLQNLLGAVHALEEDG